MTVGCCELHPGPSAPFFLLSVTKNEVGLKRRNGERQSMPELHGNVNATALLEHEMGNSTGS